MEIPAVRQARLQRTSFLLADRPESDGEGSTRKKLATLWKKEVIAEGFYKDDLRIGQKVWFYDDERILTEGTIVASHIDHDLDYLKPEELSSLPAKKTLYPTKKLWFPPRDYDRSQPLDIDHQAQVMIFTKSPRGRLLLIVGPSYTPGLSFDTVRSATHHVRTSRPHITG